MCWHTCMLIGPFVTLCAVSAAFGGEIHDAVIKGQLETVKSLVEKDPTLVSSKDRGRETPLHVAALQGQLEIVTFLLAHGADVNAHGQNECTPLSLASDPAVVREILRHKPDLVVRNAASGATPLDCAASMVAAGVKPVDKWREVVKLLLGAGAPYSIQAAIHLNDIDRVRALLKEDPYLADDPREAYEPPLRTAAREGRLEICKMLLAHKASVNDFDRGMGFPIIKDAVAHPEVVKILIEAGADLKKPITWRGGRTGIWIVGDEASVLHYAAECGVVESAKLLVDAGVDVNVRDDHGQTPLHIAAICRHPAMVRFLLASGADVNAKRNGGQTALELASIEARFTEENEILQVLKDAVAKQGKGPKR